jgi:hypothetical protein
LFGPLSGRQTHSGFGRMLSEVRFTEQIRCGSHHIGWPYTKVVPDRCQLVSGWSGRKGFVEWPADIGSVFGANLFLLVLCSCLIKTNY